MSEDELPQIPDEVECAIAAFAGAIMHPVPSPRLYSRELAKVILAYGAECRREAIERCAQACEAEAEKIKHTSHRDGIGMGDGCAEMACARSANRIRAMLPANETRVTEHHEEEDGP